MRFIKFACFFLSLCTFCHLLFVCSAYIGHHNNIFAIITARRTWLAPSHGVVELGPLRAVATLCIWCQCTSFDGFSVLITSLASLACTSLISTRISFTEYTRQAFNGSLRCNDVSAVNWQSLPCGTRLTFPALVPIKDLIKDCNIVAWTDRGSHSFNNVCNKEDINSEDNSFRTGASFPLSFELNTY